MAKPDYIYAVARIRAKELLCFGSPAMEQLMACKTYEECLRMLNEKGWGDGSAGQTPESLLDGERHKTWEQLRDLAGEIFQMDQASLSAVGRVGSAQSYAQWLGR